MHYWWASPNLLCDFSIVFLLFFSLVASTLRHSGKSQGSSATFQTIIPTSILVEKIFWYPNCFHIPFFACHVILCQFSFYTQVSYSNVSLIEINWTHIHSSDSLNIFILYFKAKIYPIISVFYYCCLKNCSVLSSQKMRPFDLLINYCVFRLKLHLGPLHYTVLFPVKL